MIRRLAHTLKVYLHLLGINPDHRLVGNVRGLRRLFWVNLRTSRLGQTDFFAIAVRGLAKSLLQAGQHGGDNMFDYALIIEVWIHNYHAYHR